MTSLAQKNFNLSFESLQKYGHVFLVGILLLIVCLMILPISPHLLDFFLGLNIAGAILILMVSIGIGNSLNFTSIPSLLLLSTLFRLGLNISSTRMILSHGEAGSLIQSFASFVTGSNLAVGSIIFLALLIIQFLVISKGAERIAEVAARFTLDALPGKQMSIDADLRAGLISTQEAKNKRLELLQESKLYGSLDGAMKFVKGDVIAGLVISVINILGGFAIGVLQKGMSLEHAAQVYMKLTIGDGLVTQIPCLLIGLSSGFILTRVQNKHETSLGKQMSQEILSQPQSLYFAAMIVFFLGFFPGFPWIFFFIISLSLFCTATALIWHKNKQKTKDNSLIKNTLPSHFNDIQLGRNEPLSIELSRKMYTDFLQDEKWQNCFQVVFVQIKNFLMNKTGVPFPDIKILVNSHLSRDQYRICIHGITIDEGHLSPHHYILRNPKNNHAITLKQGEKSLNTTHGTPIYFLQKDTCQDLEKDGIETLPPEEALLKHIINIMQEHAKEFIDMQQIQSILNNLEKSHPDLVREVVPRMLSIQKLSQVVQNLVKEKVSIRDFRLILETLSQVEPEQKNISDLTQIVRIGLKRTLTHQYTGTKKELHAIFIEYSLEDEILQNIQHTPSGNYLSLHPDRIHDIQNHLKEILAQMKEHNPVILSQIKTRKYIYDLIHSDFPQVAVLTHCELLPDVKIYQTHLLK